MAPLSFCNQRLLGCFAMEATTTIWLTKPMAPQDAESVAVMRWAIEEDAAREGSLAGECLAAAQAAGLSAEDTYVFLAYELLLRETRDRKSTRLNSSHEWISYAVFCLKKKNKIK